MEFVSRDFLRLAALLAAIAPVAAFAVVASPNSSTPTPVDTTFAFVGQVGGASGASGVAVGPHKVLTAGHVGGSDFLLNGVTYHAASYTPGPSGLDLYVITVTETLPGYYAIADSIANGSAFSMAGFGGSGRVNAAGNGYTLDIASGTRHAGANSLDFKEDVGGIGPSLISYLDTPGEASLTGLDSGGGWFTGNSATGYRLAGISSFIFNDTSPYDPNQPNTVFPSKYSDYGFSSMNTTGYNTTQTPGYTGPYYSIPANTHYFGSGAVDLTSDSARAFLTSAGVVPEPAPFVVVSLGLVALLRVRRRA